MQKGTMEKGKDLVMESKMNSRETAVDRKKKIYSRKRKQKERALYCLEKQRK
jgi:hypothetical protein